MSTNSTHENGKTKVNASWLQRMAASLGFASTENLRDMLGRAVAEAEAKEEPSLSAQERTMLLNILEFGGLRVSAVMVPRVDIVAISVESTLSDLLRLFADAGHSRVPVYETSLDDAMGMIHIKDLMTWATEQALHSFSDGKSEKTHGQQRILNLSSLDLSIKIKDVLDDQNARNDQRDVSVGTKLVRDVLFVPPLMPAIDLLAKMRAEQIHLALIVDEFGGIDGLVSIEDLVEAIVGDIEDEHDTDEELSPIVNDGAGFIASARTQIEEMEAALGVSLGAEAASHGVDTIGGLILALNGSVPKRGAIVVHPSGIAFEILEGGARRITKVRITRQLALPPPENKNQHELLPGPDRTLPALEDHRDLEEHKDVPDTKAA